MAQRVVLAERLEDPDVRRRGQGPGPPATPSPMKRSLPRRRTPRQPASRKWAAATSTAGIGACLRSRRPGATTARYRHEHQRETLAAVPSPAECLPLRGPTASMPRRTESACRAGQREEHGGGVGGDQRRVGDDVWVKGAEEERQQPGVTPPNHAPNGRRAHPVSTPRSKMGTRPAIAMRRGSG